MTEPSDAAPYDAAPYDSGHHPDLDTLAALDAGVADGTDGEALRAHLAGCATCAGRTAQLADTRALLAGLPAPQIPGDVAQRLADALTAERKALAVASARTAAANSNVTVLPDRAAHHRPRWTGAGAAAAGIAVLLAAIVGASALAHRSPTQTATSAKTASGADSAAAPSQPALAVQESGRDYRAADLDTGVRALLATPEAFGAPVPTGSTARPGSAPSAGPTAAATPGATADAPAGTASRPSAGAATTLARLRQPAALQACVDELAGRPAQAEGVDFARYQGRPAVVIILADPDPAKAQAWVVGPDCRRGSADLLRYQVVRRAR